MFARKVRLKLKPNSALAFSRLYRSQVLPVLRQQPGFKDGMTLVSGERAEAVVLSFWDRRKSAQAFEQTAYASVVAKLKNVIDGAPEVTTMVLSNSTSHKLTARS